MAKRRWIVAGGILAGATTLWFLLFVAFPPRPGVTKANFDRIEKGMTRADVEELFGKPASGSYLHGGKKIRHTCELWSGDEGSATIICDEEHGIVADKEWSTRKLSVLQTLRRWVRFN